MKSSGLVARACRYMASLSRHVRAWWILRTAKNTSTMPATAHAHRSATLPSPTMSHMVPGGEGPGSISPRPLGEGPGVRVDSEDCPPLPAPCPINSTAPQTSATNSPV